jgi:cysteine synthase A
MPQSSPQVANILELIGGTPLVQLKRMVPSGSAEVWVKCEQFNPGGSVKDRIALAMIEAAERDGKITPGKSVIVEPTSGNTGIGLALVCAVKGYHLILTMPESMSLERRSLLKAYGAELILTPAERTMEGAVVRAEELCAKFPHYFMPQQFNNPANPEVHRKTTAPELLKQLGERGCDAFVAGVGTGGTITGVGEVFRAKFPGVKIVAVEPTTSARRTLVS